MKSKPTERTVAFGQVNEATVSKDVQEQVGLADTIPVGRLADGVPNFTTVDDYTTFLAEYMLKDGDIVIHFYPSEQGASAWKTTFPGVMDRVAQEYFKATAPRLQAKFTEEMNSWWFRARGYGHVIDLKKFIELFFDALDQGLEAAVQ